MLLNTVNKQRLKLKKMSLISFKPGTDIFLAFISSRTVGISITQESMVDYATFPHPRNKSL
jgi:hypothetical protein